MGPVLLDLPERIRARVAPKGPCWEWSGAKTKGYGHLSHRGRQVYAHRLVYELLVGPIPAGLEIDHLCRNPPCVNPSHLEPVTHRENLLRGVGIVAACARKTHCLRGHEFTADNTIRRKNGKRSCWKCRREFYYPAEKARRA